MILSKADIYETKGQLLISLFQVGQGEAMTAEGGRKNQISTWTDKKPCIGKKYLSPLLKILAMES